MVFGPLLVCLPLETQGFFWLAADFWEGSWQALANSPDHATLPVKSHILQSPSSLSPCPPPYGGWHDLFRGQRKEPPGKRASLDMLLDMEIAFPKPSSSLAHSGN